MRALLLRSVSQARYVLAGSFFLLGGFQIVIVGQAAQIERTNSFGMMASLLPGFVQRGLGNSAMLLATFRGTVSFGYFHPVVCLLMIVMVMYFTVEIAHEVESGLVDLELARSLPRHWLVTRSLLVAAASAIVGVVLMGSGTTLGAWLFDAQKLGLPSVPLRVEMLANLTGVAACFGGFALLVAASSDRWATAFTFACLGVVVLYCLDFLALGWPSLRAIAWISPFYYFHPVSMLAGTAPTPRNLTVLFSASAVMTGLGYRQFQRRDL